MVGFAEYTNTYETRLGRMPFYRKGARGPDQLSAFASKKNDEYWANAGRIRDMRFAQANEYNIDSAIRSKRDRDISNAMDTVSDTRELEGLRGRTSMKLSRTGGALSRYSIPGVVKGETPMSLTVAGLSSGDARRSAQGASASAKEAIKSAERASAVAFENVEMKDPDYPDLSGNESDYSDNYESDDDSTIPAEIRSLGNRTVDMIDPDKPQTLVPALREQFSNSSSLPQIPIRPQPSLVPGPPLSRPRPHRNEDTFTSPTVGFSGAGAGAGASSRLESISNTPNTSSQHFRDAQAWTDEMVGMQTSDTANSPGGIRRLASRRNRVSPQAIFSPVDSEVSFNVRGGKNG